MNSVLDMCDGLPLREFEEGHVLLEEGGPSKALYFLKEGAVEVLKKDVQINTVSVPGAILGEVSVLLDRPHMASVRTIRPSSLYVADDPVTFLEAHPAINLHLARMLANRLNGVTTYLVDLKKQFEANEDHLGMVDEVLESLLHHQGRKKRS